jgi:GAF domain-containing protein
MTAVQALDRIAVAVATVVDMPVAIITVVRDGEQVIAAAHGLDLRATDQRLSGPLAACREVAQAGRPILVQDARRAHGGTGAGSDAFAGYAGVPIISDEQVVLGTLAAFGPAPRTWHDRDMVVLRSFADVAAVILETRRLEPRRVALAGDDHDGYVSAQEEIVIPREPR